MDLDTLMSLMRFNKFESDEFGEVEHCNPLRTPAASVANRLDLSDPEQVCNFGDLDWMVGH